MPLWITLHQGTDREITLPFEQVMRIYELGERLGEYECHLNQCGCCVAVHPKGQHDRGYIVDQEGGYNWVGPGEPEEA